MKREYEKLLETRIDQFSHFNDKALPQKVGLSKYSNQTYVLLEKVKQMRARVASKRHLVQMKKKAVKERWE